MATEQDDFSARLVRARSSQGWSQLDLSKASGVAAAQISRYEQGNNNPRPQVVAKLASALRVSFDWLLTGAAVDQLEGNADTRAYTLVLPSDLMTRIFIAAGDTHRTVEQEVAARLEASFTTSVAHHDVSLAASTAGAVLKALERANHHGEQLVKRMERIEAKLVAGGASPLEMGEIAGVVSPPPEGVGAAQAEPSQGNPPVKQSGADNKVKDLRKRQVRLRNGLRASPEKEKVQPTLVTSHYDEALKGIRASSQPASPRPTVSNGPTPSPNARKRLK